MQSTCSSLVPYHQSVISLPMFLHHPPFPYEKTGFCVILLIPLKSVTARIERSCSMHSPTLSNGREFTVYTPHMICLLILRLSFQNRSRVGTLSFDAWLEFDVTVPSDGTPLPASGLGTQRFQPPSSQTLHESRSTSPNISPSSSRVSPQYPLPRLSDHSQFTPRCGNQLSLRRHHYAPDWRSCISCMKLEVSMSTLGPSRASDVRATRRALVCLRSCTPMRWCM